MEFAMVTDGQVKELRRLLNTGKSLVTSARMTEMDKKTARHYRDDDRLPSQRKSERNYRTRIDPFAGVWDEVQRRLEGEPKLQAKTLFGWLQDRYPGQFPDSTRRTFERRVLLWRSTQGPDKAVMFPQVHHPGQIAASDFTVMNELRVTIAGARFEHTLFHCVLTYSNVESVSLCFSESFEALSAGIQKAFWEFGGVTNRHRTDSLSAAVNNHSSRKILTDRYTALMDHYGSKSEQTNPRCANENGDIESSNGHLKNVIDQALLLRGSRDFASREDYMEFVEGVIARRNDGCRERFAIEQQHLSRLPDSKLDTDDLVTNIRVHSSSTIQVRKNTYSVPSRLIGQKVDVKISAEWIDVTHHGIAVQRMPRLIGAGRSEINYRHVIDSLIRKPGAFENYKYHQDMFPTSHFRIAYDMLCDAHAPKVAVRRYLEILALAAHESQDAVQGALRIQIQEGDGIDVDLVKQSVVAATEIRPATDVDIEPPNLSDFDSLLLYPDMESPCNDPTDNQDQTEGNSITRDAEEGNNGQPQDSRRPTDRAVPLPASADVPGSVSPSRRSSCDGETLSRGVSRGVDDTRMRIETRGKNPTLDDTVASSTGQDMGVVQVRSSSLGGDASVGKPARRIVPGPAGELTRFWEARLGEVTCTLRACESLDWSRSEHVVHDVQLVGATIVDRQAGSSFTETDQTVVTLRGSDDRRPGLCAAEPRGDGSVVHSVGGTLRAGQRAADKQPGVQQVGPDLQGRDDDGRGDRSVGPPQRDHRVECSELPSGNGQAEEIEATIERNIKGPNNFMMGNSNCR
jgi:hypothetical protein